MKLNYKIFSLMVMLTLLFILANQSLAQQEQAGNSMYTGQLDNPLGPTNLGPQDIYGRLIYAFIGVTGAVALSMFILGGFQWMTAGGNPEKIKKGRDTLMWAVLGLLVIFSSYAILRAIFQTLQFSA